MKKGFTLVEMIGTVVILLILSLLVFPNLLNLIKNSKEDISSSTKEFIYSQTKLYIYDNVNDYPLIDGKVYCVSLRTLVSKDYLKTPLKDATTNTEINLDNQVEIIVDGDDYSYNLVDSCVGKSYYTDNSGANRPVLYDNMIPIKYTSNKWVYADTTQEWYNYTNKQWANAVVLNSGTTKSVGDEITESDIALWYVWIPRYKYTIFNGNNGSASEQLINVSFESGTNSTGTVKCTNNTDGSETCTDKTNGNVINGTSTYTHPAFTFGSTNLKGFWVGKFEVSTTDSTYNSSPSYTNGEKVLTISIKPNVISWRHAYVSNFFTAIQNAKTEYGITNADSHMMKNMEWGAVAYLKQSKYGLGTTDIGINNNSSYITGCGATTGSSESDTCNAYNTSTGMLASTTGNIYGVYDMSGGAYEYLMGNQLNSSNAFYSSEAGFSGVPDSKYYDTYKYDSSSTTTHARGKLGDATKETLKTFGSWNGGWYSDYAYFPYSTASWFMRGGSCNAGSGAGVFLFSRTDGKGYYYNSARAVLSAS